VQGVITSISARLNRFRLWTYTTLAKTSTAWDVTVTIEIAPGFFQNHIIKGNQRTATMPTLPAGMTQSLSFERNKDATFDWRVVQTTRDTYLGEGGTVLLDHYEYEYAQFENASGSLEWYWRAAVAAVNLKQFATAPEAYAWVQAGSSTSSSRPVMDVGIGQYVGFQESRSGYGSWYSMVDGLPLT